MTKNTNKENSKQAKPFKMSLNRIHKNKILRYFKFLEPQTFELLLNP